MPNLYKNYNTIPLQSSSISFLHEPSPTTTHRQCKPSLEATVDTLINSLSMPTKSGHDESPFSSEVICTIPKNMFSSSVNLIKPPKVGYQDPYRLSHDDYEPTPIHPRLSVNITTTTSSTPLSDAMPRLDGALDRFIDQELNEIDRTSGKPETISVDRCLGSKSPMLSTESPSPKRARTHQASSINRSRGPRFRNNQEVQWGSFFQQLLDFKQEKGHCLVPHTFKENQALSRWVKRQRYQYKLMNEKAISTMTEDRISKLDHIGFVWDSHAVAWEEHRLELVQFKNEFGHCDVPSAYKKNPSLATWVKRQRRQYKLFSKSVKSTMTQERYAALNNLGFSWEMKTTKGSNARSTGAPLACAH